MIFFCPDRRAQVAERATRFVVDSVVVTAFFADRQRNNNKDNNRMGGGRGIAFADLSATTKNFLVFCRLALIRLSEFPIFSSFVCQYTSIIRAHGEEQRDHGTTA